MREAAKAWLRDAAARVAWLSGESHPSKQPAACLTIVTFHRVLPSELLREYPIAGLAVTPEELDFVVAYLRQHYSCLTIEDALSAQAMGGGARPLAALTFDDGQLDNLQFAAPVLERHGMAGTFYVVPDMSEAQETLWHDRFAFSVSAAHRDGGEGGQYLTDRLGLDLQTYPTPGACVSAALAMAKRLSSEERASLVDGVASLCPGALPSWARLLSVDEIVDLSRAGHSIGSHTNHHVLLPQCDDLQLTRELVESKAKLEGWLNKPVDHFCYPNGDFDERTIHALRAAGYQSAVTTGFGLNASGGDLFRLRRFDVTSRSLRDRKGKLSVSRLAWALSRFRKER